MLLVTIGLDAATTASLQSKSALSPPIRGAAFSGAVLGDGGTPPYTYAVTGGTSLPAGLSLNAGTGEITGTPTTQGFTETEFTITDAAAATYVVRYGFNVGGGLQWITTTLPMAEHGVAYSTQLLASGGTPPYTFTSISGFPTMTGGSLTTGGLITGTGVAPTVPLATVWTLRVTDATGNYADLVTRFYTWPALTQILSGPRPALVGADYGFSLACRHGTFGLLLFQDVVPQISYAITSGSLPPGMLHNPSTGQLYGTPMVDGTYTFDQTATDTIGGSRTDTYTLRVHPVEDIPFVYVGYFGDNSSTVFTINHNLDTLNIRSILIFDTTTGLPYPEVSKFTYSIIDQNNIEITTVPVPDVDAYQIVITG